MRVDEAVFELKQIRDVYANMRKEYKSCVEALDTAINALEMQKWIPVTERLPKRNEDVLVTRFYDGREDFQKSCRYVEVASCYGEDEDVSWGSYSDEYKASPRSHHVIAWMPLPEPYVDDIPIEYFESGGK